MVLIEIGVSYLINKYMRVDTLWKMNELMNGWLVCVIEIIKKIGLL